MAPLRTRERTLQPNGVGALGYFRTRLVTPLTLPPAPLSVGSSSLPITNTYRVLRPLRWRVPQRLKSGTMH